MTKEQIESWYRQINHSYNIVNQLSETIDNLISAHHGQTAVGNIKQVADISTELDRLRRDREKVLANLLERCNTTDLAGVETRLADLTVRLELIEKTFMEWRRRLAVYEHIASRDAFKSEEHPNNPSREEFTAMLDDSKNQFEIALRGAADLVPNKAIIIV